MKNRIRCSSYHKSPSFPRELRRVESAWKRRLRRVRKGGGAPNPQQTMLKIVLILGLIVIRLTSSQGNVFNYHAAVPRPFRAPFAWFFDSPTALHEGVRLHLARSDWAAPTCASTRSATSRNVLSSVLISR